MVVMAVCSLHAHSDTRRSGQHLHVATRRPVPGRTGSVLSCLAGGYAWGAVCALVLVVQAQWGGPGPGGLISILPAPMLPTAACTSSCIEACTIPIIMLRILSSSAKVSSKHALQGSFITTVGFGWEYVTVFQL